MPSDTYHDDPVIDCNGAQLSAGATLLATVVTVSGEIDAANAEAVSRHLRRRVVTEPALVVDMGGVEFIGVQGLRDLFELGEECGTAGVWWVLVAGDAVRRILRAAGFENTLPMAGSVNEALRRLASPSPGAARLLQLPQGSSTSLPSTPPPASRSSAARPSDSG